MNYIPPREMSENTINALDCSIRISLAKELTDLSYLFEDSILYEPIQMHTPLHMITGCVPITQVLGRILYDNEVLDRFYGPGHFVDNKRTLISNTQDFIEESVVVSIKMQSAPSVLRFLRRCVPDEVVSFEGDYLKWELSPEVTLSQLLENLPTILDIYYKLTTRFLCSNTLPSFRNS